MRKYKILFGVLLLASTSAFAKKPDWPVKSGTGIIGFGIVEIKPSPDGHPHPIEFDYDIPQKYIDQLQSGQILVVPAASLKKYNEIPESAFIAKAIGEAPKDGNFHLSATIQVDKPGIYIVAYGPFDGLLKFDDVDDSRATYKISAKAEAGSSIRWIDQDAGDFTVSRFHKENTDTTAVLRLRMLRDRENLLSSSANIDNSPLQLNEKALERVKMIDANW